MVAVFAGLKWRLVRNRLRRTTGAARAWLIVGWCAAVVLLIGAALLLSLLRTVPDAARIAVTTLFTAQFVAWGLSPIIAFGVDETVEPAKFALLPLPPRTLQTGLLVTALVGYLPIANAVVLIGASIGLATSWWMLAPALLVSAVQLLLCVLFSRALSTAMSGLMSSRRGRDIGIFAGFGVFVVYFAVNFLLNSASGPGALATGAKASAGVLAWLPLGGLAQLPAQLADGNWGRVVVALAEAGVLLLVLWWWWARVLRDSLTSVPSVTEGSAPARAHGGGSVADSLVGTARLIAHKDLVLSWRDPMRRMSWLMIVVLALAWPLIVIRGQHAVLGVLFPCWLIGAQMANAYGWDGSALWLHLVAYGDRRRARGEVLGHAIGGILPGLLILIVAEAVLLTIRRDWAFAPAATGVALSAMFGAVAAGGVLSTVFPQAMRQSRRTMFASSIPGQKARTTGSTFGVLGGTIVAAVPAGACVLLYLFVAPIWGWIGLVVGIAVGVGVLLAASSLAGRRYLERGPEILAAVSVGDRL